jgi:hypothetical protein
MLAKSKDLTSVSRHRDSLYCIFSAFFVSFCLSARLPYDASSSVSVCLSFFLSDFYVVDASPCRHLCKGCSLWLPTCLLSLGLSVYPPVAVLV